MYYFFEIIKLVHGHPSLNGQKATSYHGPQIEKNVKKIFANILMLICVLKQLVFHTTTRFYTIFMLHFKET